jgi:hypothetical protein
MSISVSMTCPLDGKPMTELEGRLVCSDNHNHVLSIEKEYDRYRSGEKDLNWLKGRVKIHLGKLTRGK